jgi:hypothetical protein
MERRSREELIATCLDEFGLGFRCTGMSGNGTHRDCLISIKENEMAVRHVPSDQGVETRRIIASVHESVIGVLR